MEPPQGKSNNSSDHDLSEIEDSDMKVISPGQRVELESDVGGSAS